MGTRAFPMCIMCPQPSFHPKFAKSTRSVESTPADSAREGIRQYIEKERRKYPLFALKLPECWVVSLTGSRKKDAMVCIRDKHTQTLT